MGPHPSQAYEGEELATAHGLSFFECSAMPPGRELAKPFVHIATGFNARCVGLSLIHI